MKTLMILIAFMFSSGTASAACQCICISGSYVLICDNSYDMRPFCPIGFCNKLDLGKWLEDKAK